MEDTDLLDRMVALFGADVVCPAPEAYLVEPRGKYRGAAAPLARPRDVGEVSAIMRFCHEHAIAVIPYGGGTGLVGGQVREQSGGIILSLERMNAVRAVYAAENVLEVEAGMILADVQAAAQQVDRIFPLSLASEGSCRIGGNLATNAGGVQVLRYGNARDLCLGIEAVLPNGDIYNGLSRLRKDNTGYDLRDLLIGSEGTLGVITAASLNLFPTPRARATSFIAVRSVADAIDLLAQMQSHLDGAVSAFELINAESFRFLAEKYPTLRLPFETPPEWSVLLEVSGGEGANLMARLEQSLIAPIEAAAVTDAIIPQSEAQRTAFWTVRETIPLANRAIGAISSQDVSVPISEIPAFIHAANDHIAALGPYRVNCFGHLGDGNLHYNIYPPKGGSKADYRNQVDALQRAVHDLVDQFGGSISAEHGIGRMKVADLARYGDPVKLALMASVKQALDPTGIMNPDVIFPAK